MVESDCLNALQMVNLDDRCLAIEDNNTVQIMKLIFQIFNLVILLGSVKK